MSENPYAGPSAPMTAWTISGADPALLVGLPAPAVLAAAVAPTQQQAQDIARACRGLDARQALHQLAADPTVDNAALIGWAKANLVLGPGELVQFVDPHCITPMTAADLSAP